MVKFPDDTKGGKVIENTEDRDKLQRTLDCLCDWAENWGMSFNLAKCKIIHVGPHNPGHEYFMRETKLRTTEEEKDMDVRVTRNLKPPVQCSNNGSRTNQAQLSLS